MSRQARLDAPGALHHVMVRGINKSAIFKDDQDKARFLRRLGENITEARASVYAWVLMDNHGHILFKSGAKGISAVMRKLLTCLRSISTGAMAAPATSSRTATSRYSAKRKTIFWPLCGTSI
jgi:REP element-mobilizing transposase RayT